MKKLLAIVLLAASMNAVAEEYLTVNLASLHVASKTDYNEFNFGLGYAWDTNWKWFGDVTPQIGFYKNSEGDQTLYFMATKFLYKPEGSNLKLGYTVGAAYGYEKAPIMPIVGGAASYRINKHVHVNGIVSVYSDSEDGGKVKPVLGVQLAFPLGKGK